jgi:hypothetical protein
MKALRSSGFHHIADELEGVSNSVGLYIWMWCLSVIIFTSAVKRWMTSLYFFFNDQSIFFFQRYTLHISNISQIVKFCPCRTRKLNVHQIVKRFYRCEKWYS